MIRSFESDIVYRYNHMKKLLQWQVFSEGDTVTVEYGQVGGQLITSSVCCKGKNLGRSNETSPFTQAIAEASAKFDKQVRIEDYHIDPEQSGRQFRAQLSLDLTLKKDKARLTQPLASMVLQYKLNGMRLVYGERWDGAPQGEFMTRKGVAYPLSHLQAESDRLLHTVNTLLQGVTSHCQVLDGEVYRHGWKLQKILSAVKKYQPKVTEELNYYLFDLYVVGLPFKERYELLQVAFNSSHRLTPYKHLSLLDQIPWVGNHQGLEDYSQTALKANFEGVMVKDLTAFYAQGRRTTAMFKYKPIYDIEGEIIAITPDKQARAMFLCRLKDGTELKVTPKMGTTGRKVILSEPNKWIGKWITIEYRDLSEDNIPQHGIGIVIRDCLNGDPVE